MHHSTAFQRDSGQFLEEYDPNLEKKRGNVPTFRHGSKTDDRYLLINFRSAEIVESVDLPHVSVAGNGLNQKNLSHHLRKLEDWVDTSTPEDRLIAFSGLLSSAFWLFLGLGLALAVVVVWQYLVGADLAFDLSIILVGMVFVIGAAGELRARVRRILKGKLDIADKRRVQLAFRRISEIHSELVDD